MDITELFSKFIIEDGNLIIGKCNYHKELAFDKEKVSGGGWFIFDKYIDTFTFYGESEDFGKSELEDIQKCINEGKVYTNFMCTHSITDKFNFLYEDEEWGITILKNKV